MNRFSSSAALATNPVVAPTTDELATPALVVASNGASAELHSEPGSERLAIRNPQGQLLIEYDVTGQRTIVHSPGGDLVLRAEHGSIDLQAAEGVRCSSGGMIALESAAGISLHAAAQRGPGTVVSMSPQHLGLVADDMGVRAKRARVRLDDAKLAGHFWSAAIDRVQLVSDKVETQATRVLLRAQQLVQRIAELQDKHVGRVRTVVAHSWDLRAANVDVCADDTTRIDGERIELG